ncbi:MAG: hypothetical protein WBG42_00005, partial [Cryomorphaceae bacterium]
MDLEKDTPFLKLDIKKETASPEAVSFLFFNTQYSILNTQYSILIVMLPSHLSNVLCKANYLLRVAIL